MLHELNYDECLQIEGGKASTVFTGLGVAAFRVAIMASSAVSVPAMAAGYALYEIGSLVAIGGICGG